MTFREKHINPHDTNVLQIFKSCTGVQKGHNSHGIVVKQEV